MKRIAIALLVCVTSVAVSAAADAKRSPRPAKVTICHKTSAGTFVRMRVKQRSVRAHRRHGDVIRPSGACPPPLPITPTRGGLRLTAALNPVSGASGSGSAVVRIDVRRARLCYRLTTSGLTATAAHIHEHVGSGPVVVPLATPNENGGSQGCTDEVDPALLRRIANDPSHFYVNVHTAALPRGAIQGDLTR